MTELPGSLTSKAHTPDLRGVFAVIPAPRTDWGLMRLLGEASPDKFAIDGGLHKPLSAKLKDFYIAGSKGPVSCKVNGP